MAISGHIEIFRIVSYARGMKISRNGAAAPTEPEIGQADRAAGTPDRFRGKVALLSGKQPAENHELALRLARLGSDVAVVYRPDLGGQTAVAQQAAQLQAAVEAAGQRCLLLPADGAALQKAQPLVDLIITTLGRLDFFISRPVARENGRVYATHNEASKQLLPYLLPQHQLMKAAMQAILSQ
jgi:hypothetical protein